MLAECDKQQGIISLLKCCHGENFKHYYRLQCKMGVGRIGFLYLHFCELAASFCYNWPKQWCTGSIDCNTKLYTKSDIMCLLDNQVAKPRRIQQYFLAKVHACMLWFYLKLQVGLQIYLRIYICMFSFSA